MKVLFATSECVPFIKTGGLADVVGALPSELCAQGCEARVILPKYGAIAQKYKDEMRYISNIYIKMGWRSQYCGVFEIKIGDVVYYFVDNEFYFGSQTVYDDIAVDIERFAFFDKAVLALLQVIDFWPDVIHCNDWQTGMVPVLLRAHYAYDERYSRIKTVMTIHNLRFRGVYDKETIADVCELDDSYFTADKLEFYKDASFLKGGLVYADFITTVSPTYACEIMTDYFGEGLNGLLSARSASVRGIINGINYDTWNPAADEFVPNHYDARNFVSAKKENKLDLQKELGLEQNDGKFLVGMVTRLTGQKGLDLIECVMDNIFERGDIQMVILGTGESFYENMLRHFEWKYKGTLASVIKFDNGLSHRVYAACDAFLMPSLFEPCGLSQMISMRYGTLPIVRETGGLRDSVQPYNEYENTGTGFSFANYNAHEMLGILNYAKNTWYNNKKAWQSMVKRAMKADFSWRNSAKAYIEVYKSL